MAKLNHSDEMEELQQLKEYVTGLNLYGEVIPSSPKYPINTLAIMVPDDNDKIVQQIYCNYIPLPNESAEFTKFLHIYSEIELPAMEVTELSMLRTINLLNEMTTVGSFLYKKETNESKSKIQYRYTLAASIEEAFDEGAFCEVIFLTIDNIMMMQNLILEMMNGETLEKILEEMKQKK